MGDVKNTQIPNQMIRAGAAATTTTCTQKGSHFSKQRTTDRGALCARLIEFIQRGGAAGYAWQAAAAAALGPLMTQPQFFNDFSDRTLLPECLFN